MLLNHEGFLAEGASTNVFVVSDGTVRTPPLAAGILAGITREVVLELVAGIGVPLPRGAAPPRGPARPPTRRS